MKKELGARRLPSGKWQIFVKQRGQFRSETLPENATLTERKNTRKKLEAAITLGLNKPEPVRSFADDAREYLALVTTMPSYQDRAYRIGRWVEVFGPRERSSITSMEITRQLERWRQNGSKNGGPVTPATLNTFKTAIQHLFTKLDGKSAQNIVKDVVTYDERYSKQIRARSMIECARIVRQLRPGSKQRAVLHALMWTGWPNELLKQIQPEDVNWKLARVKVSARKKGKGMDEEVIPVVPRALLALRRLDQGGWLGKSFSNSSLWKAVSNAAEKESRLRRARGENALPHVNVYTFRHSFGTWAAGVVKDQHMLKLMLRTNSIARYTRGADQARLEAARDQLTAALNARRPKTRPATIRVEAPAALPPHVH